MGEEAELVNMGWARNCMLWPALAPALPEQLVQQRGQVPAQNHAPELAAGRGRGAASLFHPPLLHVGPHPGAVRGGDSGV